MTTEEIIIGQISDPFRIILLGGLVYTMLRTRSATGTWVPLAAGILFVAALIPSTTSVALEHSFMLQFAAGILSNLVITGVLLGLYGAYKRLNTK